MAPGQRKKSNTNRAKRNQSDGSAQSIDSDPSISSTTEPETFIHSVPMARVETIPQSSNGGTSIRPPQQMTVLHNSELVASSSGQQILINHPLTIQATTANTRAASSQPSQVSPNTAKTKCKNLLSAFIRLASDQPGQTATNVINSIQSLIDGEIQPEEFTNQLQSELHSSPKPCLIPFLEETLPYLRHSLMMHELSIDGVRPPPPGSVQLPPQHNVLPINPAGAPIRLSVPVTGVATIPQSANVRTTVRPTQQMTAPLDYSVSASSSRQQFNSNQHINPSAGPSAGPSAIRQSNRHAEPNLTPYQVPPPTPYQQRLRCKSFLTSLIREAADESRERQSFVEHLVQALIDGTLSPSTFFYRLQSRVHSEAQPRLISLLEQDLPFLRYALMTNQTSIDGINPPRQGPNLPGANLQVQQNPAPPNSGENNSNSYRLVPPHVPVRFNNVQNTNSATRSPAIVQPNAQPPPYQQRTSLNLIAVRLKLILTALLRQNKNSPERAANLRIWIQSLIDGKIYNNAFAHRVQNELNSIDICVGSGSYVGDFTAFLDATLPHLRYALMMQEMAIDGIRPPPPGTVQRPQSQPYFFTCGLVLEPERDAFYSSLNYKFGTELESPLTIIKDLITDLFSRCRMEQSGDRNHVAS